MSCIYPSNLDSFGVFGVSYLVLVQLIVVISHQFNRTRRHYANGGQNLSNTEDKRMSNAFEQEP